MWTQECDTLITLDVGWQAVRDLSRLELAVHTHLGDAPTATYFIFVLIAATSICSTPINYGIPV